MTTNYAKKAESKARIRAVRQYIKKHGLKPGPKGFTSPYITVATKLKADGHEQLENESDRAYVSRLFHLIHPTTKRQPTKKQPAQQPAAQQPAEQPKEVGLSKEEAAWIVTDVPQDVAQWIASPDFLLSYDWRRTRMVVLKRDGRTCACCGITPKQGAVMCVDHIKPRRKYPELALDLDNLQILCEPCNHGKANWDETDWKKEQYQEMKRTALQTINNLRSSIINWLDTVQEHADMDPELVGFTDDHWPRLTQAIAALNELTQVHQQRIESATS